MRRLTAWLLPLVLLCACGVGAQRSPESIEVPRSAAPAPGAVSGPGGPEVTVFLVRGEQLEPVLRPGRSADVATALTLLVSGPLPTEVAGGLRTALAPQALEVSREAPDEVTVEVAVTRDFTSVTGVDQLLAVAQVVWTVTQLPGIERVRFVAQGQPLEVPTDEGLSDQPVGRNDYRSVAPPGDAATPTTRSQATTSPPGTPATPAPGTSAASPSRRRAHAASRRRDAARAERRVIGR